MLNRVKRKSPRSVPAKSDLSELELPLRQYHTAQAVQRAQHDPDHLTPHDVLQLQRVMGNHAVGQLLAGTAIQRAPIKETISSNKVEKTIQRHYSDSPAKFIPWLKKRTAYKESLSSQAGDCAPAAKRIGAFLQGKLGSHGNMTVKYRGISLLTPFHHRASSNLPHFVITVSWGTQTVVIDPTQAQFGGGVNQVVDEAAWEAQFAGLSANFFDPTTHGMLPAITPKLYSDFDTFTEADDYAFRASLKYSENDRPTGTKQFGDWNTPEVFYPAPAPAAKTKTKSKGFFRNPFG